MRITKALPALVLLLALVAGTASAYISENPRQGLAPISAEFHPEPTTLKPGLLLGFELRFLGFCVRSGLSYNDPYGLDLWDAIDLLGKIDKNLAAELGNEFLFGPPNYPAIIQFAENLSNNGCLEEVVYEILRDPGVLSAKGWNRLPDSAFVVRGGQNTPAEGGLLSSPTFRNPCLGPISCRGRDQTEDFIPIC